MLYTAEGKGLEKRSRDDPREHNEAFEHRLKSRPLQPGKRGSEEQLNSSLHGDEGFAPRGDLPFSSFTKDQETKTNKGNIDRGADPDIYIAKIADFYDREALTKMINELY